jgi:hypothetical protein
MKIPDQPAKAESLCILLRSAFPSRSSRKTLPNNFSADFSMD